MSNDHAHAVADAKKNVGQQIVPNEYLLTPYDHNGVSLGELAQVVASGSLTIFYDEVDHSFAPNTENWYANQGVTPNLASATSIVVQDVALTNGQSYRAPVYSGGTQSFVLNENAPWQGPKSSDPVSGGYLFINTDDPDHPKSLRIFTSGSSIQKIVWYQFLDSGTSAANFSPSGVFSSSSNGAQFVPFGKKLWYVSQLVGG
jgi:hypothetical protein